MKTVNFIEAVNSGKRFKVAKAGYDYWYEVDKNESVLSGGGRIDAFSLKMINSQFELEEKSITVTESEFERVWSENVGYTNVNYTSQETGFVMNLQQHKFKREMGF